MKKIIDYSFYAADYFLKSPVVLEFNTTFRSLKYFFKISNSLLVDFQS